MGRISVIKKRIAYETAKLLKDKGFDILSSAWYCNYVSNYGGDKYRTIEFDEHNWFNDSYEFLCYAPTQSKVMRWLRDDYDLHIEIEWKYKTDPAETNDTTPIFYYYISSPTKRGIDVGMDVKYDSYEDAAEAGIKFCVEELL